MTIRTEFVSGLIRLHILYHAARGPVFGLELIRELRRHGYELSPGTLYPILHGMEERGYLRSAQTLSAGKIRRVYKATATGRRALAEGRAKVRELFGELFAQERRR
jgi:DNA-binding PadR family transcriptional regulator